MTRSHVTVVLAMSADGKITDFRGSAARFGSINDKKHLETQIALADGVLFGANTLRAYGTTLSITNEQLLAVRAQRQQPPQPVHIVCANSANFDSKLRFFEQSVPHWLLTRGDGFTPRRKACPEPSRGEAKENTDSLALRTQGEDYQSEKPTFERIILAPLTREGKFDWQTILEQLVALDIKRLAVLGGGQLVASLLEFDCIDELCLTICPLILGGVNAPSPVAGLGFSQEQAKRLELIKVETIAQEVFLHYRFLR